MNMMPLKWEGMKRCIEFWVMVMRMNEDRLLKVVMLEALERGRKVKWVQNLKQSLEMFGWGAIYLCGRPLRFVNGRGEEGSDGCGLEGSKEWMEEGGTEAP